MQVGQMRKDKTSGVQKEVSELVKAGTPERLQTVDFSLTNRERTCIEVDFPILPINRIATIEGNVGKPIYQTSKWWARRRPSVFRAILLASAIKAPAIDSEAAKIVWRSYYGNHQNKGAFGHIRVADTFMGGGTTLVEAARLGMKPLGIDLNPIAWFVVKTEFAKVDPKIVDHFLTEIENEVKPRIMPYYSCRCPRGHRGKWIDDKTGRVLSDEQFNPLELRPEERPGLRYEGPEVVNVFWAKHAPCQITGCDHITPVIGKPVIVQKELSTNAWIDAVCSGCRGTFDVEQQEARIAPSVPFVCVEPAVAACLTTQFNWICPGCGRENPKPSGKPSTKRVSLSLVIHPSWLSGESMKASDQPLGGSPVDSPESSALWHSVRAARLQLVEVRGQLPEVVTCPITNQAIRTDESGGTVTKRSTFACGKCGISQDVLACIRSSGKSGPMAPFLVHGYCPDCDKERRPYSGRFYMPVEDVRPFNAALFEWELRRTGDLNGFWPREKLYHYHYANDSKLYIQPDHGFTHFWQMFNSRQLLVLSQLLKAIMTVGGTRYSWELREYVLAAFQQYLRNQNMYCFWNIQRDTLEPLFSNNNYHPKNIAIESSVFSTLGRGNWQSCTSSLTEAAEWAGDPWELVSKEYVRELAPNLAQLIKGTSEKVYTKDPVNVASRIECGSASDIESISSESIDMVVTDPPFGGLIHYADMADFFYVWLKIALKDRYPEHFSADSTPRAVEVSMTG